MSKSIKTNIDQKPTLTIPGMLVKEVKEAIRNIEKELPSQDLAKYTMDLARQVIKGEGKSLTPNRLADALYEDTGLAVCGARAIMHYILAQHFNLDGDPAVVITGKTESGGENLCEG